MRVRGKLRRLASSCVISELASEGKPIEMDREQVASERPA
jgi:hypothetical protein